MADEKTNEERGVQWGNGDHQPPTIVIESRPARLYSDLQDRFPGFVPSRESLSVRKAEPGELPIIDVQITKVQSRDVNISLPTARDLFDPAGESSDELGKSMDRESRRVGNVFVVATAAGIGFALGMLVVLGIMECG